ncbi:Uncharacterised protein [Yersinia rohdei]|uniref:Uncharacterized protein n=1 Tax=Yersinia rohdei TaxID=29485 RepID=A0A0U1HSV6_YERRO|nr:Uncharacterised protein [Yersinia rohdei]CNI80929.1 Uncharacterised protein [Yersinia rohdei]CQI89860.1 Uncharacterised protein [Yersinia rohdei]CQJ55308.1 Uncharacterised protein [Yersinia rohdei]
MFTYPNHSLEPAHRDLFTYRLPVTLISWGIKPDGRDIIGGLLARKQARQVLAGIFVTAALKHALLQENFHLRVQGDSFIQ